jgi:diguanylate cyclase (GGDEF)-like protein/PAS domain S-box-containing protein
MSHTDIQKIVLIYAVFAGLWVLISDEVMTWLPSDNEAPMAMQTLKGWLFVGITSTLLYLLLRRLTDSDEPRRTTAHAMLFNWKLWQVYLFAILVTLFTLLARLEIPLPFDQHSFLILFMLPILLSAAIGGMGPGALATALSAISVTYFILPPIGSFRIAHSYDLFQLGFLIANGLLVSYLSAMLQHAYHRSERERQKTESHLADKTRATQLLESIADGSTDAIFAKDLQGRYLLFNHAAERFVGKAAAEVIGRDDTALFPPADAEAIMRADRQVIEADQVMTYEDIAETTQGHTIFLSTKGPLHDSEGRVIGLFGISRDITERKRIAAALHKQEETYRSLFDNMMNSVVHARLIFDAGKPVDIEYLSTNPAFAEVTGITAPVVGRRISEVIPGYCENNPESLETFGRVASTGVPTRWEHYLRELDRWFSFMIYSPAQGEIIIVTENITERKKAELALKTSEKRFADIVAASADWIWEVDAGGHYTYVADSVHEVLGYTPQDMLGKTPFDFMPADEAARVGAEFAGIAAQRKQFLDLDNINLHKDGSIRHILTNGVPMFDEHGELLGYRGVDKDITEKKKNELLLIENEARLRLLLDHAPGALALFDRDMRYLTVSRRWMIDFGLDDRNIIGLSHYEVFPEIGETLKALHRRGLAGECIKSDADRFERADGSAQWLRWEMRPWHSPDGNIGGIVLFSEDITARIHAEEQQNFFSEALRQASTPLLLADPDTRITYMNPAFSRLFGYALPDLQGLPVSALVPKNEAALEAQDALVQEIRRVGNWSGEADRLARDGTLIPTTARIGSILDVNGKLVGFVGSYLDLRPLRAREQMVHKLASAIEQSSESIVITDLDANIEYVNETFVRNTGYSREEVVGKNSRLLHSGKTPKSTYDELWGNLTAGKSWEGKFYNKRKDGSEYIEHAIIGPIRQPDGTVTHYVAAKEDITNKMRAEAEIHRLAFYDTLTGLPNRALLLERMTQTLATTRRIGHHSALMSFNIDRFKNVNDAGGQMLGDALLNAVSQRLQQQLREGDVLARIAGDEFVILLTDLALEKSAAAHHALHVAKKIHTSLVESFPLGNEFINITACLGIVLFPENNADTPLDVLRRSNTALHHAKTRGTGQTAFFDNALDEIAKHRFDTERELHRAIAEGELRVFLQPQVNANGKIVGAEALVRWQHPQRGLVPPGAFIPIAEESNLVIEIGTWMLTEVCRLLTQEALLDLPVRIAVNISPRQFRQHDFVSQVQHILAITGADPMHLTLEVTEGLVIDNMSEVIGKMHELSEMGIHFSMDDFGTGYSSLSYLKRLPIHELKIDKSFIQDITSDANDAALVETILAVAKHMHLKVVAEGVETAEQADLLNRHGDVIHQGYFFHRPEPAAEAVTKIVNNY